MSAAGISVLILYGVIATVIAIQQWRERWVEPDNEETHKQQPTQEQTKS